MDGMVGGDCKLLVTFNHVNSLMSWTIVVLSERSAMLKLSTSVVKISGSLCPASVL